jgi:hypothetical protein
VASNPVSTNPAAGSLTADRATQILGTVTSLASVVEEVIAGSGVGGSLNIAQVEQLTGLFGSLAGVAIQAAHDVVGKPVTPDSVLALMPAATVLVDPAAAQSSAASH